MNSHQRFAPCVEFLKYIPTYTVLLQHIIEFVMASKGMARVEAQTDNKSVGSCRNCGFEEESIVFDYLDGSVARYNCILNK